MKSSNGKTFGTRLIAVAAAILVVAIGSAVARPKLPAGTPVDVSLHEGSFENPRVAVGAWTSNGATGWDSLPATSAGVWRPGPGIFSSTVALDGEQMLYINRGGVSQTVHTRLQPLASYSFSVEWWSRSDWQSVPPVTLQIMAGTQVLATCTPTAVPPKGQFATVNVVYYSDGSSTALGQPITVQIANNHPESGQLNVDDAQLTYTDLTGTPASAFTATQECSVTVAN